MEQNTSERVMRVVFLVAAIFTIFALVAIIAFIFGEGLPFIFEYGVGNFIFGTEWKPTANPPSYGILPMIAGSVFVTIGAIVVGVPIGVLTSIFMARFCPQPIYGWLRGAVNLMAAIPSIVYGYFGLEVIVPWIRNTFGGTGTSMLAAILVLGIMILPTIINMSETSIRAVPDVFYRGAIGLGATHERAVFTVEVPAATSGIVASIILGVGRAIGETMAVIMVAGNQTWMPQGLLKGVRTMTANIVLEMSYATAEHREALIATSVVLFIFILIINSVFLWVKGKGVTE